ncbi:SDR family oxidoreductase [Nitratireductor sp. XY-223]|uniref:SDR family NAD(P)-dependent oxidoreductase n=1 Tax=Nitratireductor sp. XY-223 TaxID=2561926 RepID=UPI0010A9F6F7|nr:SDR family oxidoreductase [Nitratireductor sp. XY-223]
MDDNRSIVIFGGARGIGAAVARRFAASGARVFVGDVLADEGEALARENRTTFARCDVAQADEISALFDLAVAECGRIDVVFNNVGIARYGEVDGLSLEDWELTLRVNLTAQFLSCKRAVAEMKKSGGGVIVNTASILGHASQKTTSAYAASKAGVMALTRTVAIDHARDNIRCVSVSPGTIDTPLVQIAAQTFEGRDPEDLRREWADHHPLRRLGRPEEVAETVYFLASDKAGFITGSDILIDGGIRSELYAEKPGEPAQ